MKFGQFLVLAAMLLWTSFAVAQTVPGRFPPGTVYGNPNAVGGAEANPSTVQTFATRWTTAQRPTSPTQGTWGFNTDGDVMEFWDGANWRSVDGGKFDALAWGAKCDGVTDDSTALNNMLTAAKAEPLQSFSIKSIKISFPANKYCRFTQTLNFAGLIGALNYWGIIIDGAGSELICGVAAGPCIDATGARFVWWRNIAMRSETQTPPNDPTKVPTYGVVIGRTAATASSCDGQVWEGLVIAGVFSKANFYNRACEVTHMIHPQLQNFYSAGPGADAMHPDGLNIIFDGGNYWNVGSAFASVTFPSCFTGISCSSIASFNGVRVEGGYFQTANTGPSMWIGGLGESTFAGTYASTATGVGTGACHTLLWYSLNDYYANNNRLTFDMHFEAQQPYTFCLNAAAGSAATAPIIRGFRWLQEHAAFATSAVFHIDPSSSIASISAFDMDVEYTSSLTGPTSAALFAEPAKWSNVTGRLKLPAPIAWTPPVAFTGTLCFAPQAYNPSAGLIAAANCQNYNATRTWTTVGRPASPAQGTFGFNTDSDTLEFFGGKTQVVSATIASGGSGCSGTVIMTGTTGTGSKFIASAVATAGVLSGTVSFRSPTGQTSPGSYTVNPTTSGETTTTGGGCTTTQPTLNLTMGNIWSTTDNSTVSVLDFGCIGNDLTRDESVCINNAISYAHALGVFGGVGIGASVKIYFPPRLYAVDHPINMTGWSQTAPVQNARGSSVTVDGYGAIIFAKNSFDSNKPVVDMMGSAVVHINGLSIYASSSGTAPSVGLQFGVVQDDHVAGYHVFNDINVEGSYTLAAMYNLASEVTITMNSKFSNSYGTGTPYVVIVDGIFNFSSQINSNFVTITTTANRHQSNTHIGFYGGTIQALIAGGTAIPLYVSGNAGQFVMDQTYLNTNATKCVQLDWGTAAGDDRFSNGRFNIHCEGNSMTNLFELTGALARPTLRNMEYRDEVAYGSTSLFKIGSGGITGANFNNLQVNVGTFFTGSATIFDTPGNYSVTGNIAIPSLTNWVAPATWWGCLYAGTARSCTNGALAVANGTTMPIGLQSVTVATSGTSGSYVPGDRLTVSGGTSTQAAVLAVNRTQVRTATVQTAGTTCANVSTTLTGVSGTGTKWTYTTTVSGGTIPTGVITLTTNGSYTANPLLTSGGETVVISGAGASCSVAPTITLTMGVLTGWPVNPGVYSIAPNASPVAITGGTGTGATFNAVWSFVPAVPIDVQSNFGINSLNTNYGFQAGTLMTSGVANTFVGTNAGGNITTGSFNACFGTQACQAMTTGANTNTGIGYLALSAVTTGVSNVALGDSAGAKTTTSVANLFLGNAVGSVTQATGNQNILIGTSSTCDTTASNTSNQFKVCGPSTDLMVGDMTAASLNLAMGGGLQLKTSTVAGLPTCTGAEGKLFAVTDAPVTGHTIAYCDGTNWHYVGSITTVYGAGTVTHTLQKMTTVVRIVGCGPGAGGGSGAKQTSGSTASGGGGGGGGGCFDKTFRASDISGGAFIVAVTAGGAGGTVPGAGPVVGNAGTTPGSGTCISSAGGCGGTVYVVGGFGGGGAGGQLTTGAGGGSGGCHTLGGAGGISSGAVGTSTVGGAACLFGVAGGFGASTSAAAAPGPTYPWVAGGGGGGVVALGGGNGAAAQYGSTSGGGAGGGLAAAAGTAGGAGGYVQGVQAGGGATGAAGGVAGTNNGTAGTILTACQPGTPGGGGGGNFAAAAGNGGNGGQGAGGGGGGSTVSANTPGTGGAGGAGFVCVFETI